MGHEQPSVRAVDVCPRRDEAPGAVDAERVPHRLAGDGVEPCDGVGCVSREHYRDLAVVVHPVSLDYDIVAVQRANDPDPIVVVDVVADDVYVITAGMRINRIADVVVKFRALYRDVVGLHSVDRVEHVVYPAVHY